MCFIELYINRNGNVIQQNNCHGHGSPVQPVFEWDMRHRTAVHCDINVVTLKSSRFSDIPLLIIGIKPAPDDFPPQLRAALRLSAVRWRDLPPSRSRTQSARCRSYFYIIADTGKLHTYYISLSYDYEVH